MPTPRTRAECPTVRPCPHVACRMHLGVEVSDSKRGRLRVLGGNYYDRSTDDEIVESLFRRSETCAIDVANKHRDGARLISIAEQFGCSREMANKMIEKALASLGRALVERDLL